MADNVSDVGDDDFEEQVLKANVPVLVDFWAPWCGPCKSIAPVVAELADQFSGRLKVVKMNVDDNPKTPTNYDVRGIPNLVLFKDGSVLDRIVGAVPKEQLTEAVEKLL